MSAEPLTELLDTIDPGLLEPIEETLSTLHHDVGKYVTRIARNVPAGGEVPPALGGMLLKDVYETHRGTRASARFAQLVQALPPKLAALAPLRDAAAALARIDADEPAARTLAPAALMRLVVEAREVEQHLAYAVRAVRVARARRSEKDA